MPTLAFFPWFALEEEKAYGSFRLIPYRRGKKPAGANAPLQATIDAITKPYVRQGDHAIQDATLVAVGEGELTRDLSQEEVNALFAFSELLAFSGLSRREFFGMGFLYSNRDLYRLAVQEFTRVSGATKEVRRRRDGSTTVIIDDGIYRVHRPLYLENPLRVFLDDALLNALMSAQTALPPDRWTSLYEAIVNFNRANTDSDQISKHMEILLSVGAFERLLASHHGREDDLAEEFGRLLAPAKTVQVHERARLSESLRTCSSMREAWIRDLFRLRGDPAHGKIAFGYPSSWTLDEHLLLTSYLFPLLLKCTLAQRSMYSLTREDLFDIEVFERLLCQELFKRSNDENGEPGEWPWDRVRSDAVLDQIIADGLL